MLNLPKSDKKRIVIAGCGFAGLTFARRMKDSGYQVVIIDKHNYHQFPPLFYQVASAGLEPDSILFPIRKIFQKYRDFYIRKAEILGVDPARNIIITSSGETEYDKLVLAFGATNSFFGSKQMEENAKGMKTIAEVLDLRNSLLMNFEKALLSEDAGERDMHLNIVIIGGGPSGVEIAGALSEMNKYVLPKDYPELKDRKVTIYLIEAAHRILQMMSEKSSEKATRFLRDTGVQVLSHTKVTGCDEKTVYLENGEKIRTAIIIWTAGIRGNQINGLAEDIYTKNGRIIVDRNSKIKGYGNIFAIGDISYMTEEKYPDGHPQVAQVAIQQARLLAYNMRAEIKGKPLRSFRYRDLGTMATIGRNLAVVELPFVNFQGMFAWFIWMFIHLMSIVGVKNRLLIFINWAWKYFTYDQSLRLILRPKGCV